jgi:hypothetical protein
MSRMLVAFVTAIGLAMIGASGGASAQAGCQPTITQPCAKAPDRGIDQTAKTKGAARADDANEPKDHSPRIRLDQDTDFKFGTGGIGLGRRF